MNEQTKVYFTNEPFVANIPGPDGKSIRCTCTPMVCSEETPWGSQCGVGIECLCDEKGPCEDDRQIKGWIRWGLIIPKNPFASWRATEILRLLTNIEDTTLCAAWYASERSGGDYDLRHTNSIIAKIGRKAYDNIMSMPVPEQIVRIALDNPHDWDSNTITREVRAGTILWRQEFTDAGIKHPDEIDAAIAAKELANRPWWKKLFQKLVPPQKILAD